MTFRSLIVFALVLYATLHSYGQSEGILNQLLAPGQLMVGHAKLEGKDCLKCHEAGKGVQPKLCLDCHDDLRKKIETKKGFHVIALQTKTCIQCHSDHKGREYDSTKIDEKNFDHGLKTGYDLRGKHSQIKCQECHTETRQNMKVRPNEIRYLAKQSTCVSCHKKDDKHNFTGKWAQQDCSSCHGLSSWKSDVTFNHNTDTNFKLVEKHGELKCSDCHNSKGSSATKYSWPQLSASKCLSCHTDFHKGNLSSKYANGNCVTCHSQSSWKIIQFNHANTGFDLKGKHAVAKCVDCHKQTKNPQVVDTKHFNFTGLKTSCLSCHQDHHKFGDTRKFRNVRVEQCLNCHTESGWSKTHSFDHSKSTRFAIDGQHRDLKCNDCHFPNDVKSSNLIKLQVPTYQWPALQTKTCENCHASPHGNQFSAGAKGKTCTACHSTEGWFSQKSGGFDHSKARFPLTGAHKAVRCSDCHGSTGKQNFKFTSVQNKFCIDCHENIHEGKFAKFRDTVNCTQCHSTQSFKKDLTFDHDATGFKIAGLHKQLKCEECHTASSQNYQLKWPNYSVKNRKVNKSIVVSTPVSKFKFFASEDEKGQCIQCHKDIHLGQLGNSCQECHSVNGWKPVKFDHNTQSKFILKGRHSELECNACHKAGDKVVVLSNKRYPLIKFKPIDSKCVDCHKDYHLGQLSQNCAQCHQETNWKKVTFNHNQQSQFKLFNKHATLQCSACHKPTARKIEYKNQIRLLTRFKPMGTACFECHKDPHKGNFGRQCADCHSDKSWKSVKDFHKNFSLSGVHYTFDCAECHRDGKKLSGVGKDCLACHQKDDVHNGTLPKCSSCHNQQFWDVAVFKHSMTRFPLRGAHRVIECSECHRNGIYKGLSSQCVSCHLTEFQANPGPHGSGNTNCVECHRNTFTFGD